MMFGASRVAESARIDKKRAVSTSREQCFKQDGPVGCTMLEVTGEERGSNEQSLTQQLEGHQWS